MSQLFLQSSQDDVEYQTKNQTTFTASTSQISHLADVFSSITAINSQALMVITPKGLSVYAEYNHILNAHVTVDSSLFTTYNIYTDEDNLPSNGDNDLFPNTELRIGIDIGLIAESFVAATSSSSVARGGTNGSNGGGATSDNVACYITYNGDGHPLIIDFEDRLMSEKIEFLTFYLDITYPYDTNLGMNDDDEQYNLIVNHNEIQVELILKSDVFANLLQDLLQINTVDLYIFISNKWRNLGEHQGRNGESHQRHNNRVAFVDNQLNFISKGAIGHSKLLYPNNKATLEKINIYGRETSEARLQESELVITGLEEEMKPVHSSLITCFNFHNFIKIFRAVKLSTKCKIMKDLSGVLSVQLLCKNSKSNSYAGTLITFNMLEISTMTDEFESDDNTRLNLNNIFDDDFYEYIRDYNNSTIVAKHNPNQAYQDLQMMDGAHMAQPTSILARERPTETGSTNTPATAQNSVSDFESFLNNDGVPQLSYASFKQTTNNGKGAHDKSHALQVNDTIYENHDIDENSNDNDKKKKTRRNKDKGQKRKHDDNEDKHEIETVGGAIEVPLFL